MPLSLGTNLYSPCNPVTTDPSCNKLYQNPGWTVPAAAGVYVIFGKLYFVNSSGTVTSIQSCPGKCGWDGPDCSVKNDIQCNVIQYTQSGPINVCTNVKAACCACLDLGPCP